MDAIECIKTRMSIRKFKRKPVPKFTLVSGIRKHRGLEYEPDSANVILV